MNHLKKIIVVQFILISILAIFIFIQATKIADNESSYNALSERVSNLEDDPTESGERSKSGEGIDDLKAKIADHESLFMRHAELIKDQENNISDIQTRATDMAISIEKVESETNKNSDNINSQQIALDSICKKLSIRYC